MYKRQLQDNGVTAVIRSLYLGIYNRMSTYYCMLYTDHIHTLTRIATCVFLFSPCPDI